jgi:hypothetical protein
MSLAHYRESPETHLWFVGHSNSTPTSRFLATLVWDGAIATPRSGQFMQNSSKLEYFFGLVATSLARRGPARIAAISGIRLFSSELGSQQACSFHRFNYSVHC